MGMGRYSDNVIFFVSQGGLRAACFSCEKSRQKNIVQNSASCLDVLPCCGLYGQGIERPTAADGEAERRRETAAGILQDF